MNDEVEQAAQRADLASLRARGQKMTRKTNMPQFLHQDASAGHHFLRALGEIIMGEHPVAPRANETQSPKIPQRITIFIDGLERLPLAEQPRIMEHLIDALNSPAFLAIIALDSDQLVPRSALARLVQIPYQMNGRMNAAARQKLIGSLLQSGSRPEARTASLGHSSVLDRSLTAAEISFMRELMVETDLGPRELKRLTKLYRLIRCLAPDAPTETLVSLIIEHGVAPADREVFDRKIDQANHYEFDGVLGRIIALSRVAAGGTLSLEALSAGRALARRFGFS